MYTYNTFNIINLNFFSHPQESAKSEGLKMDTFSLIQKRTIHTVKDKKKNQKLKSYCNLTGTAIIWQSIEITNSNNLNLLGNSGRRF